MGLIFLKGKVMERIWGGARIKSEWGYEADSDDQLGEYWAITSNSQADSIVTSGQYAGKTLSALWKEEPGLFGRTEADESEFPLLVKLIDAREDLSIQVHPDDAYAKANEHCRGKRECWYILDCPENAQLVVGNRAKDKEELKRLIDGEDWEDLINRLPVKKGDFIQIDPGTLHSITGGIILLEVQTNSDVTYRVYDYGRLQNGKPRELHIRESKDVMLVPDLITEDQVLHDKDVPSGLQELIHTVDYRVRILKSEGEAAYEINEPYLLASVIEGSGSLNGEAVRRGDHFLIPHGSGPLKLSGSVRIILASP